MSLIVALILGGIIGWIASRLVGREEGLLVSVVIGIVGAVIGSFLAHLFGSSSTSYLAFSWVGVFWTLIGAVIFAGLLNSLQHRSSRHHV